MATIGYVPHDGKCLPLPGISRGAILSSYSCNRGQKLFCGTRGLLKSIPSCSLKRISVACNASNNYKWNPDFNRRQKGSSKGKNKQYQEPEQPENTQEMDYVSSKNGSLLSATSNTMSQASANRGQPEKEIVDMFRKVQAILRERAAIKEEKKIETAQQGQRERRTFEPIVELLKQVKAVKKKSSPNSKADFAVDQLEKGNTFEDEQNLNLFGPNDIDSEENIVPGPLSSTFGSNDIKSEESHEPGPLSSTVGSNDIKSEESHEPGPLPSTFGSNDIKPEESHEPGPLPSTRPASNFRRKSPVPRMKFQPVFSAEDMNSAPLKSQWRTKKTGNDESESVALDGPDELSLNNQLDPSDSDETAERTIESSAAEVPPDLCSLKLSELKELAKSRGMKGYSKLKKEKLVELLSA